MNITRFSLEEEKVKKGPWSLEEDEILINYIRTHGEGKWPTLPKRAGLNRSGKSCRLRWLNYLRPGIIKGNITKNEQDIILKLQALIGNRWSVIATMLPGRTDNEIKNYWNTYLSKRSKRSHSTTRRKRSQTRKGNQPKHNQESPENDPHWKETNTFKCPIIDENEGGSSHYSMAINNNVVPTWTECINMNDPNLLCSSTTNNGDTNGPPESLMVPDHDHGQCSKVNNTCVNLTTRGSTVLEEEEQDDDDLLRFLMDFDSQNLNSIFDQNEIHAQNPNMNDQYFPRVMIEEDHSTFNVDVAKNDLPKTVTSLPYYDDPLLMNTYDNLDNQAEIVNEVDKKSEPTMESDLQLDLKKLAYFLGVEYDWDDE